MKNYLLLFLALLPALAGADAPAFQLGPVVSRVVAPGTVEVRLTATATGPLSPVAQVPLVWSPLRMSHDLRLKGLLEDNLLDTLYEEDLNDDQNLDELFVHAMDDGRVRIDQMPMEPLSKGPGMPQSPYRDDGSPKIYRLGPSANDIAVEYFVPPLISIYLRHLYHLIHVRDFPSPVLVVHLFEPCQGLRDKYDVPQDPSFKVILPNAPSDPEAEPKLRWFYSWEPWPLDASRGHAWIRGWWVALPLPRDTQPHEVSFQITASQNTPVVGLSASVSYAQVSGTRLHTPPLVQPLFLAPSRPIP